MTRTNTRRAFLLAAIAAFGVTSLGLVQRASAQPWSPYGDSPYRDRGERPYTGHYDDEYGAQPWSWADRYRDELGRYGPVPDHFDQDMAHYDRNRDGVLNRGEQRAYFRHLAEMGLFGPLSRQEVNLVARFGSVFDRNRDGRITASERRGIRLLVVALRRFDQADWNRDRHLSRRELRATRGSLPPLRHLDRNRDGFASRREVQSSVVRAYRGGLI
jgi:hypothetical protein